MLKTDISVELKINSIQDNYIIQEMPASQIAFVNIESIESIYNKINKALLVNKQSNRNSTENRLNSIIKKLSNKLISHSTVSNCEFAMLSCS